MHKNKRMLVCLTAAFVVIFIVCMVFVLDFRPKNIEINSKQYNIVAQTDADVEKFAQQFCETEALIGMQHEYIPTQFNDVYTSYNELQKKQGFDLEKYKGKKFVMYTYKIAEHKINGSDAYISVMVIDERVVGGHISTFIKDSPMYTFYGEEYD